MNRQLLIYLSILSIGLAGGIGLGLVGAYQLNNYLNLDESTIAVPGAIYKDPAGQIHLEIDFGEWHYPIPGMPFYEGGTAFDAVQMAAKMLDWDFEYEDYGDMGKMVVQIEDSKNGDKNRYWQFWVNGQYSEVGADSYVLQERDLVRWVFTDAQQ